MVVVAVEGVDGVMDANCGVPAAIDTTVPTVDVVPGAADGNAPPDAAAVAADAAADAVVECECAAVAAAAAAACAVWTSS